MNWYVEFWVVFLRPINFSLQDTPGRYDSSMQIWLHIMYYIKITTYLWKIYKLMSYEYKDRNYEKNSRDPNGVSCLTGARNT